MEDWTAMSVLPNVELDAPIENEMAALVPSDDARVRALCNVHRNLRELLLRFTDAFGVPIKPSVLILRSSAPRTIFTVEASASFRDLIAISVVPYNRALELLYRRGHRPVFSDAFWIYPWMVDKNYEHLISSTPAQLSLHDVSEFKGQSAPQIPHHRLARSEIDLPLLSELMKRWLRRYSRSRVIWADQALFRSLNMANQAALTPAATDTTIYDVGRSIALWVSAFEILVHPKTSSVTLSSVYQLLESTNWKVKASRARRYQTYQGRKRPRVRRSIACWLYGEIYSARNDFLHGNPITKSRLTLRRSKKSLFLYAAPLYRIALTAFLPLAWTEKFSVSDAEKFGKQIADRYDYSSYQRYVENALHTSHKKPSRNAKLGR